VTTVELVAPAPRGPVTAARQAVAVVRGTRAHGRRRVLVVAAALAVACALVMCVSISVGDFPIPLADVIPAIFGRGGADADFIVRTLRLPRALTGVLVGAAFGLSGAIFQTLARNPLASPDVIGVTSGASAAAVLVIVTVGATSAVVAGSAFAGALLTALAIYALSYKRGVSSYRLVLVGIGIAAMLQAVTSYLLTRAQVFEAQRALVWLTGSLNGRGWEHVRMIGVALAVLAPLVVVLARPLRALQLGDDAARGLGVRIERAKLALLGVAVALAAVATAASGPIEFVAFVAAPIACRLTRAPGPCLLPSALFGALLVVAADLLGRRLFAPVEIPVGVVTGVLGAPYLLWLLARSNRIGRSA
jgi:iron complex transport system permease protein